MLLNVDRTDAILPAEKGIRTVLQAEVVLIQGVSDMGLEQWFENLNAWNSTTVLPLTSCVTMLCSCNPGCHSGASMWWAAF